MIVQDRRFDFRGALNTAFSPDALDITEVREALNCRVADLFGSLAKRAGTKRIHTNAIGGGAKVLGVVQWDGPSNTQIVAISNGKLYYKTLAATDFTELTSVVFSTTARPSFARHVIAGTPTLYIGDGALLAKFTGSAVSEVTGGSQPDPERLLTSKSRMYALDGSKVIYWSTVADPDDWSSVDPSNGGQANVETYDTEGCTALAPIPGGVAILKENSIARYQGTDATDIRIDQETDGISAEAGTKAPLTVVPFESMFGFLSDRGYWVANESQAYSASRKILPSFREWDQGSALENAVAVNHKAWGELWVFGPSSGSTENDVGYVMSYQVPTPSGDGFAWTGPWEFEGFNVCSACSYEKSDGTETVLLGGYDGFIREAEVTSVGAKDDVLLDGTGGTNFPMQIELPELLFGDPTALKILNRTQWLAMDLGDGGVVKVTTYGEEGPTKSVSIRSRGDGLKQYAFRPAWRGRRPRIVLREETHELAKLVGTQFEAKLGRVRV